MKFNFTMNREDYLQYYLFNASRNERLAKRRKRTRLFPLLLCIPLSVLYLYQDMLLPGLGFVVVSIVWYLMMPRFDGKMYQRSFERFVDKHLKDDFGDKLSVELLGKDCILKSRAGESRFSQSQIIEFFETGAYFFLFMDNGQSTAIPKNQIENSDDLKRLFTEIVEANGGTVKEDQEWAWS